jgi:FMN phosphatase YigB (HAD superfamily)
VAEYFEVEKGGGAVIEKLFADQVAFNKLIWDERGDDKATVARLKDLTVGMVEEALEFLRTYDYKSHRRPTGKLPNVAHSHEELIDMFKFWLSLADVAGFPMERLEELYYAKSRVVQYRYQEEWLKQIDRPSVIVDIDGVLANYVIGMCTWAKEWGPALLQLRPAETMQFVSHLKNMIDMKSTHIHVDQTGVTPDQWRVVKHEFRIRGGKVSLPVYIDAHSFLEWCQAHGWIIILVTSRPVDRYPNIFTDTLAWLDAMGLPFDHLWWATDKTDRLEEAHVQMRSQIVFAVDDDKKFVAQFRSKHIKTYWLDRSLPFDESDPTHDDALHVRSLHDLMTREDLTHTSKR